MSSLDPVAMFFVLGFLAGLLRSELRLPPAIYEFLSIVLLISIGLKGGVELAKQDVLALLPELLSVMALGFLLPGIAYPVLRGLGRFPRADAASIAAHYGSVSVGTYAVAVAFLDQKGVDYESHAPLYVVLLEMPAILVGIVLARGLGKGTNWGRLAHEAFLGKGMVLLGGSFLIAWLAGPKSIDPLGPLFFDLFRGFPRALPARDGPDRRESGFGAAALRALPACVRHSDAPLWGLGLGAGRPHARPDDRWRHAALDAGSQRVLHRRPGGHASHGARGKPEPVPRRFAGDHVPLQCRPRCAALPAVGAVAAELAAE
jgi:uncharacterized membrane protein